MCRSLRGCNRTLPSTARSLRGSLVLANMCRPLGLYEYHFTRVLQPWVTKEGAFGNYANVGPIPGMKNAAPQLLSPAAEAT